MFGKAGSRTVISIPIHGNRPLRAGLQAYTLEAGEPDGRRSPRLRFLGGGDTTTTPSGSIEVKCHDGIIHARYRGEMTMALVQEAARQMRAFLPAHGKGKVLCNTGEIKESSRDLTRWMLKLNEEIQERPVKDATAPDRSEKHEFFSEIDEALAWLKS
jgi:hypothetical protein